MMSPDKKVKLHNSAIDVLDYIEKTANELDSVDRMHVLLKAYGIVFTYYTYSKSKKHAKKLAKKLKVSLGETTDETYQVVQEIYAESDPKLQSDAKEAVDDLFKRVTRKPPNDCTG